jgi:hypothetical protein
MPRSPHYISPPESDADSDIIVEDSLVLSEEDSDSDSDDEEDAYSIDTEVCDDILREDYAHSFSDKQDKQYYIGSCWLQSGNYPFWTLANSISPRVFFRHSSTNVMHYLWLFSLFRIDSPHIHILQLHISSQGVYTVVIKTFWLRIVQRTWRRIHKERQDVLKKRASIPSLRERELRGKVPLGLRTLPTLLGIMS